MVVIESIHLMVDQYHPYFQTNLQLENGSAVVDYMLEDQKLLIDKVKTDGNGNPIMVQDPKEGEIPLMETVPLDKEVKGLLRIEFILDTFNGAVASRVVLLPEDVERVLGYNINTSINKEA